MTFNDQEWTVRLYDNGGGGEPLEFVERLSSYESTAVRNVIHASTPG